MTRRGINGWNAALFCGAMLMAAGAAQAQDDPEVDCANAQTQMDMTFCAEQDYDAADQELNKQYKKTRAAVAGWDAELSEDQQGAEKALLAAQRAWIAYRDAHCETYGFQSRGGTIEPMLVAGCMAELTRARTKELQVLSDEVEN